MTIDTAIRMDSEDTPTPYLSIQASDGTSRYALQQYLIDFKRIRILEQDYELTGQDHFAEAPPLIVKRLIKERDRLQGELNGASSSKDKIAGERDRLVIIAGQRRKRLAQLRKRVDELLAERDELQDELERTRKAWDDRVVLGDELAGKVDELRKERDVARKERDEIATRYYANGPE